MSNDTNPLVELSESMAAATAFAATSVALVDARRRLPASGVTYSTELILTADHVVEREEDISVLLADGSRQAASVVGRDPGNDPALLRVSTGRLTAAKPADRQPRVGQLVLALGRPSEAGIQASLGVISAIGGPVRTGRGGLLEQYLRTDTTPYPGFSGGPLVDTSGQVLGVNTSGLAHGGVALTIPAGLAWQVAAALAVYGRVRRGYLGVRSQPVAIPEPLRQALDRQQETGLLLVNVEDDGPAAVGGLLVGDILVGLAGEDISDPDQLLARLIGDLVGKSTPVEILRGGLPKTIQVTIGER